MHDWSLLSVSIDWEQAEIHILFRTENGEVKLIATDFTYFSIPRQDEWGRSISVLESSAPITLANGLLRLGIQMQSGDVIELVAKDIQIPI